MNPSGTTGPGYPWRIGATHPTNGFRRFDPDRRDQDSNARSAAQTFSTCPSAISG
jgi:hypothetical protein